MTDHLPECDLSRDCGLFHGQDYCHNCEQSCICAALRACEQRVLAEREADGPWFRSVVHECCVGKQTAYAAGVRDAIDAIDAVDAQYEVNPDWVLWECRKAIEALGVER